MNSKKTKGALFSSVIALVLCFSMLLGTTFAWFTDEVKSANNIIKSGNLDVEVVDANGESIQDKAALFEGILWEPGVVAYENLTVSNVGTLALKYNLGINFLNENFVVEVKEDGTKVTTDYGLSSALKVAVVEDGVDETIGRDALVASITEWTSLRDLVETGVLYPENNMPKDDAGNVLENADHEKTYGIVIYWQPGANDNNWNVQNGKTVTDAADGYDYLHIDLGINLFATQYTYEEDSFDHLYDKDAELPVYGIGSGTDAELVENASAYEIPVYDINTNKQVGYAVVYANALAGPIEDVEVQLRETDLYEGLGVVIGEGEEAVTYNVDIIGLNNSGEQTKVGLKAVSGYNTATIYHYDEKIGVVSYNEGESYVEFLTNDFSPFTVVYSNVEEGTLPDGLPKAVVTDKDDAENVTLEWKAFGPVSAADARQQLYSVYTFTAPHDATTVENCQYKGWTCDYYVSVDQAIDAGTIFLGGNYGSYGWVGFTNPEAVQANVDIPLLGSVSQSPWTYEDIVSFVGTFHCGVAEAVGHEGELAGVTFTVKLRLTNPEDETEYYDVNTVKYKFAEKATAATAAELKDALAAGEKEIVITDAITLTESLSATDVTFIGDGENAGINFDGYNIGGSNSITYKNLNLTTISLPNTPANGERYGWYGGIDYNGHSVANYVNCTISGVFTTYSPVVNATDCTFDYYVQDGEEFYNIFMYAACDLTATRCTFTYGDRAIKAYSESVNQYKLTLTDCSFVADEGFALNKALINVSSGNLTLSVTNNTVDEALNSLDLYKTEGSATVTVQ